MKITEIIGQNYMDFSAIVQCEHCGDRGIYTACEDTPRWHQHTLPNRKCTECGKSSNDPRTTDQPTTDVLA